MAIIEVKKVPTRRKVAKLRDTYATICYYYPQYTLKQVAELKARDLSLLLKTARKIEAGRMYNLVQIVASPNTKNGKGVKRLSEHFKKESK